MWDFDFFINSILLGLGLAMDAFTVSLANGLNETKMKSPKMLLVSGTFGVFQGVMPLIGWFLVHTVLVYFSIFEHFIPWIALILLGYIGGKMLFEGIKCNREGVTTCEKTNLTFGAILLQGVATSIDALSVGFTIASHTPLMALVCALIIAVITLVLCLIGIVLGKKFGTIFSGKAEILGGSILIIIGLEIFIKGLIGLYA